MVHYEVDLAEAATHRFRVRVTLPPETTEVIFPSWAPGSYLMREFARNVREIHAHHQGAPVPVTRAERNRWLVRGPCTLEYDVYAREKTVRSAFLDETLALFVPTNLLVHPTFPSPATLSIPVPAGHTCVCPLGPAVHGPALATYSATDIDQLHDSPVAIAPFERTQFMVHGVPHVHSIEPGHGGDVDRMNRDLAAIVTAASSLFGNTLPYRRYDFITVHVKDGRGGLEHKDGTVLMRPRRTFTQPKDYEEFVTLAAHEHFHAWNVKRIHPAALGPRFDYAREAYTPDLWWLEGGTVYYEERICYRAGLVDEARHLERLSELLSQLRSTPGRRRQSLRDASLDAWIKYYRPSEDSPNSAISYYIKGAVVLWALDLELRGRSRGEISSDTLLARLWSDYGSRGEPYPDGAIERIAVELGGGGDFERWLHLHLSGTDEVQIEAALDRAGLCVVPGPTRNGAWLGIDLDGGSVKSVREDGPSWGVLSAGDELIAIQGERLGGATLSNVLRDTAPGSRVQLVLARDGRIREGAVLAEAWPANDSRLAKRDPVDVAAAKVRDGWLARPEPSA